MGLMNRLANCGNKYQGTAKRVLCICSAGLLRSPTAAVVLNQEYGYNTRSAGCNPDYAMIPVDAVLIAWADEIVVMEKEHLEFLPEAGNKLIKVLNIPDRYGYGDPELISLIKKYYADLSIMEKVNEVTTPSSDTTLGLSGGSRGNSNL